MDIFDNMEAAFKYLADKGITHHGYSYGFMGGDGELSDNIAKVRRGASEQEQEETRRLISRIEYEAPVRHKPSWEPQVCGAYPMVPDYLAGMPENMRHRVMVESEASPLRLVVEVNCQASVSAADMRRRGAVIAALAMALSETRPVEVWASWGLEEGCGRIRLDNNPLSLSVVCAVFCTPAFVRGIRLSIAAAQCGMKRAASILGIWTKTSYVMNGRYRERNEYMRGVLQLDPQDLFIPGARDNDEGDPDGLRSMLRNPVAWVQRKIADTNRDAEGGDL